jgi:hypothetical protein
MTDIVVATSGGLLGSRGDRIEKVPAAAIGIRGGKPDSQPSAANTVAPELCEIAVLLIFEILWALHGMLT